MNEQNSNSCLMIAGSIVLAGIIIAGAIIYSGNTDSLGSGRVGGQAAIGIRNGSEDNNPLSEASGAGNNVRSVTKSDHIRGEASAPVRIVEFSDPECPFCKRFHETMKQAVNESKGQVAWIYRHFPLDSIHSKARKEAEATECANELGGNEKFWAYLDKIFEVTPSNNGLDLAQLPKIAEQVGLNKQKFQQCLDSGKFAKHIQEDLDDALKSGGTGTPYSIAIAPNSKKFVISGAQPYQAVKQIIDIALSEK